ncbi:aromatic ring-hydroxylating oxygenase subunit alpha [Stenomitos frigidus]|uniref:Rieske (2Fe-2S) protein n=1 Tax=Stenomitos frigidus ULC18 TaxID=2107698 RepID=A0A2T1E229_9CYAN|nr:aromatic ring-hydroxylating dioxygenase subunit alpha [Stenomitos frigidus]PSB26792.1 Rieske (2Fe-2S) protein [Stenomitos frigidus ULC18]
MLVTQQPILKRFWYPVMPISALAAGPQPFQLLGENLALWLDHDGRPAAVRDRCCHRSAKLSKGEAIDGSLRCPYHGWSFNAEGLCTHVPQLASGSVSKTYRVNAYRCQERYGYVWVCLDEPLLPLPEIPEAIDPQFRQIPEFYEVWHCAGLRLMENSFDNAHPHFVHAKTFGVEQEPVPPQPDDFEETDFGLRMRYVLPVFNSDIQKQNLQMEAVRTVRISEGTWYMPFIRTLKITYPNGLVHLIFTAATPIDDRSSQIVQFCLRNDTEEAVTAESVVAFDRAVTLEDRLILEGTDYDVPLSTSEEQHMMTDKPGIVMRRKLAALIKGDGGVLSWCCPLTAHP